MEKTLRQELIDFANYLGDDSDESASVWIVDKYLKSINSASNETRIISENEGEEKCCPTCKFDIDNSGKENNECIGCGERFENWVGLH